MKFLKKSFFNPLILVCAGFLLTGFLHEKYAQKGGKRSIEMEEELIDAPDEEEKDQTITVAGEDEQIVRPRKRQPDFIQPTKLEKLKWIDYYQAVQKEGKENTKRVEKAGKASLLYAPLHTLDLDLDILKSDDHGKYRFNYFRQNREYIEQNGTKENNSARESDDIDLSARFNITPSYTMYIDFGYMRSVEGLQANTVYSSFSKDFLDATFGNRLQFNKNNRLDLDITARYNNIGIDNNTVYRADIAPQIVWEFVNENRFGFRASLYSFMEQYASSYSITGGAELGLYLPLWSSLTGAKKLPWKGDLYIAVNTFYNDSQNVLLGPKVTLSSLMGDWYSAVNFFRSTGRLYQNEEYYSMPFHAITESQHPYDVWEVNWTNTFPLNEKIQLKSDAGYSLHDRAYESYSVDGIYYLRQKNYTDTFAGAFLRFTFFEKLFLEGGAEYHYFSDAPTYVFPYWVPIQLVYETGRWEFTSELKIGGRRVSQGGELTEVYLLNFSIKRKIDPTITFELLGENLLDQDYLGLEPYKAQGLSVFGGLHVIF